MTTVYKSLVSQIDVIIYAFYLRMVIVTLVVAHKDTEHQTESHF